MQNANDYTDSDHNDRLQNQLSTAEDKIEL
jgi:hypothetical protein